jgi:hypothetical protein
MNPISRKLHELNKESVIAEPTEARFLIKDDKEMQLHKTSQQILERHVKDIEDFKNNLNGSTCPVLSDADQTIVDESNRLIMKRFFIAFQNFGKAFVFYGNPTAEWAFWIRLLWLIEETQKYAIQVMAEEDVLNAPDFFNLCAGEQDERLKPVYEKWDKTVFSEESFKHYLDDALKKAPIPKLSPEELEEMERQEQADIEFDDRVLKEKCPTCPKPCEWYKKEKEKRQNGK